MACSCSVFGLTACNNNENPTINNEQGGGNEDGNQSSNQSGNQSGNQGSNQSGNQGGNQSGNQSGNEGSTGGTEASVISAETNSFATLVRGGVVKLDNLKVYIDGVDQGLNGAKVSDSFEFVNSEGESLGTQTELGSDGKFLLKYKGTGNYTFSANPVTIDLSESLYDAGYIYSIVLGDSYTFENDIGNMTTGYYNWPKGETSYTPNSEESESKECGFNAGDTADKIIEHSQVTVYYYAEWSTTQKKKKDNNATFTVNLYNSEGYPEKALSEGENYIEYVSNTLDENDGHPTGIVKYNTTTHNWETKLTGDDDKYDASSSDKETSTDNSAQGDDVSWSIPSVETVEAVSFTVELKNPPEAVENGQTYTIDDFKITVTLADGTTEVVDSSTAVFVMKSQGKVTTTYTVDRGDINVKISYSFGKYKGKIFEQEFTFKYPENANPVN
jgi:hypothetical protein